MAGVITEKVNTAAQYGAEIKFAEVFTKVNRTRVETFINASGAEASYVAGLILGRVNVGMKVVPWVSTATDGSQYPIGCLYQPVNDLADAGEQKIVLVLDGEIDEAQLAVAGAETLATIVDGKTLKDRLESDCTIAVATVDDHTTSDNWPS